MIDDVSAGSSTPREDLGGVLDGPMAVLRSRFEYCLSNPDMATPVRETLEGVSSDLGVTPEEMHRCFQQWDDVVIHGPRSGYTSLARSGMCHPGQPDHFTNFLLVRGSHISYRDYLRELLLLWRDEIIPRSDWGPWISLALELAERRGEATRYLFIEEPYLSSFNYMSPPEPPEVLIALPFSLVEDTVGEYAAAGVTVDLLRVLLKDELAEDSR